jgi:hypothetical protein
MADANASPSPKPPAPAKEKGEMVTYTPGPGDPPTAKWRGVEFKANVPIRVTNAAHVDAARGNRFFHVGEGAPEGAGPRELPKNAMEYRAHVVDWMERVHSIDDIAVAWSADRSLRERCEVGQDDISFLGTLVEPKLKQMRVEAGMSENDVAGVFVKHGVLDLPWRS